MTSSRNRPQLPSADHCPRCGYPGKDKRAKKGGSKRWSGTTAAQRSAAMRKVRKGGKADDGR